MRREILAVVLAAAVVAAMPALAQKKKTAKPGKKTSVQKPKPSTGTKPYTQGTQQMSGSEVTLGPEYTLGKASPMNIAMTKKDAADWFGPAPDLSLIARSRGADWLWSYFRGYYRDPDSPTGWNNTVFDGVGMPHVLWELQGQRVLNVEISRDVAGNPAKDTHGNVIKTVKFDTVTRGTLSPAEYDIVVRDLVNFMTWMAEPNQVLRKQVGIWVLFVLAILIALSYALYKEFWKDVH